MTIRMTTSTAPSAQSQVQQVPMAASDALETAPVDGTIQGAPGALDAAWAQRLGSVLWQLGYPPEAIDGQLDLAARAGLSHEELELAYATLSRDLELSQAGDAWLAGTQVGQVGQVPPMPVPGQGPGVPDVDPPAPPTLPPGDDVRPPGTPPPATTPPDGGTPTPPAGPPKPGPTPPDTTPPGQHPPGPTPPGGDADGLDLTPWLVGAGLVGAGVLGAITFRDGARNVRALRATAAAFDSGAMHQGGLQAISDARMGARFTGGIGTGSYLQVATPIVNRVGSGGRLTSVARGHLDQAELLASATALRRGAGDAVAVHEPMRRAVLSELEGGRSLASVLDDLDRSAAGARPVFDNPQLERYARQASIVEQGRRVGGQHVTAGVSSTRPELALEGREIVETGRSTRINLLTAGRNARLGSGVGLADGIGSIQGVNVSTLNPAMQARAVAASGVDPALVDAIGLRGAYMQRWRERVALGGA